MHTYIQLLAALWADLVCLTTRVWNVTRNVPEPSAPVSPTTSSRTPPVVCGHCGIFPLLLLFFGFSICQFVVEKINQLCLLVKLLRYSIGHAPCYMYFLLMYVTIMYQLQTVFVLFCFCFFCFFFVSIVSHQCCYSNFFSIPLLSLYRILGMI